MSTMLRVIQGTLCLLVLVTSTFGKNQQAWSHHTYNGESYSLKCESDKVTLTGSDVVTWNRHGMTDPLMTGDHFELRPFQGASNAELHIKKVTDQLHGIYICHIKDRNDVMLDSVVLGLNRGTRLYHDYFDKYRENVVVGAIAAGSTLFLILAVCFINHFRYLSDESLEKRRQRKEQRLHRDKNGLKNQGFTAEMTEGTNQTNGSNVMESSYVHF